jgi:hypothetical protein
MVACQSPLVRMARNQYLAQGIEYVRRNLAARADSEVYEQYVGVERGIQNQEALSIFLIGGLIRPVDMPLDEGWLDTYFVGFGGLRLLTPGFESFGFTYIASFFQRVAPVYVARLGESLYGDWTDEESSSGSSIGSTVNQAHQWWTEGVDPTVDMAARPRDSDGESTVAGEQ